MTMDEDLSIFFDLDEFASEIYYLPDEPGSEMFPGVADFAEYFDDQDFRGAVAEAVRVTCPVAMTPDLSPGAPFAVNGKRYKFVRRLSGDEKIHELLLERDVRPTFT